MKALGFAINLIIIQGLYYLGANLAAMILLAFTFIILGGEVLLIGKNKSSCDYFSTTQKQNMLFWALSIYFVLSVTYYNILNSSLSDNASIKKYKNKLKALSFSIDTTAIFFIAVIFSLIDKNLLITYLFISILYIYHLYFSGEDTFYIKISRGDFHILDNNIVRIKNDNKNTFYFLLFSLFTLLRKGIIEILYIFIYIYKSNFEMIDFLISKSDLRKTINGSIEVEGIKIILNDIEEKDFTNRVKEFIKKNMLRYDISFEDKQNIFFEYTLDKDFSIEVIDDKTLKLYPLFR